MRSSVTWQSILKPGWATDIFASVPPAPFDPAEPEFSPVNAWWLSELSRLVYRREPHESGRPLPSRDEVLARVGLRERAAFRNGNLFAALAETAPGARRPFAVLVFRGSAGRLDNWLANFDLTPVPWPTGGRVHAGFKGALLGFWPAILESLREIEVPVFHTGHSLGAALATLAATLRPPRALYTFGSPRVGNARFVRNLKSLPVYRIAAPRDIVTSLPPSVFPFGYRHAGRPFTFPAGDETGPVAAAGPAPGAPVPARHGVWRRLVCPPAFLADHAPLRYTEGLAF